MVKAGVNRRGDLLSLFSFFLMLMSTLLSVGQAWASDVAATVDRNEIHANESLTLTVSGDIPVDSAFSFFDLNTLNVKAPDTTELEKDFDVLDRQQNYKVQIINNVNESVVNWTYTLMPKRSGTLSIPAMTVGDSTTQPISISVLPEQETTKGEKSDVYLETELDTSKAYVQQQALLTVRLFYANDLVRGELDHPDHPDALIRQLGKQREFSRYVDGRQYKVVERSYAIFAQKTGKLEIAPLQFTGSFVEPRTGRSVTRRTSSSPLTLDIEAPPSTFTGASWLPVQSYNLQQTWSTDSLELPLGQTLTRTLQQQALGQEGVNLPPLNPPTIEGLKFYSEPSQTDTQDAAQGVTGSRQDVQMIVATRPGVYQLPDVEVKWWDVVNNKARTSKIPGRTITVTGDGQTVATAPTTSTPAPPMNDSKTPSEPPEAPSQLSSEPPSSVASPLLLALTIVFAVAWLVTGLLWFIERQRRKDSAASDIPDRVTTASASYRELKKSGLADPFSLVNKVPAWLAQQRTSGLMTSQLENEIRPLLNSLQGLRFGKPKAGENDDKALREAARALASSLIGIIEQHEKSQADKNKKGKSSPLPNLYTV